MEEATGINFTACENYENKGYLIYQPNYPWCMSEKENKLTKELLTELFISFVSIISDKQITIDYLTIEDC